MLLERFQYFDFPLNFAFLDRFEHLDDDILVIEDSDAHVDLGVLPLPNFGDDLILIDIAA